MGHVLWIHVYKAKAYLQNTHLYISVHVCTCICSVCISNYVESHVYSLWQITYIVCVCTCVHATHCKSSVLAHVLQIYTNFPCLNSFLLQAFYEHKTAVCSEAGDSGIGSQALGDVEQELTCNSQEECDPTSLSPKRNSIDSHSPSSLVPSDPPQHQNSNGLSPPSTPIISSSTVDPKILQHSLSTSTNASSTSSSALLPVNDE